MSERRSKNTEVAGDYQIPRNSLALLMIAQAAVVLPHAAHLSFWIIAVALTAGYWRWMVYLGRWSYPTRVVKTLLVVMAGVGVALNGSGLFSLETFTSLLVVSFALKLVEMRSRRDAYLVIFLGYFLIATEFLFDQSIGIALYELLAAAMVTAAMVGMNQLHTQVRPLASLNLSLILIFQALPLMLVLFLFFPRIAPLWSVPLPDSGRTGITDRVAPGDFASLSKSDEIVFSAVFENRVPNPRKFYWRGVVYSHFQEGLWTQIPQPLGGPLLTKLRASFNQTGSLSKQLSYQILMEPTQARWLFALKVPRPESPDVLLSPDYRLLARDPVNYLFKYEVTSRPDVIVDATLTPWQRQQNTQLSRHDNPRAYEFAQTLYAESEDPNDFIERVLRHIRSGPYRYTLEPPKLSRQNSIDAFWFDTQAGFCSHYAGAFVYLMRAAGIPARMVGGYQGGEINPLDGHIVVRQYDAHAWAEVWLEGQGWVRKDPTAAVAPERIEQGLDAALSPQDRSLLASVTGGGLDKFPGIENLTYLMESMEHRWNMWVVGYDTDLQAKYLQRLLGKVTPARVGMVLMVGGIASMSLVVAFLFWRGRVKARHPVTRAFVAFASSLERFGIKREPWETPQHFLARLVDQADPQQMILVEDMEQLLYNPEVHTTPGQLRKFRRGLQRLKFRILVRR